MIRRIRETGQRKLFLWLERRERHRVVKLQGRRLPKKMQRLKKWWRNRRRLNEFCNDLLLDVFEILLLINRLYWNKLILIKNLTLTLIEINSNHADTSHCVDLFANENDCVYCTYEALIRVSWFSQSLHLHLVGSQNLLFWWHSQ